MGKNETKTLLSITLRSIKDSDDRRQATVDLTEHVSDDYEQMMVSKSLTSLMLRDKRMCYACLDAVMDAIAQMKKEAGDKFDLDNMFDDMKSKVCRRIVIGDGVLVLDEPEKDDNAGGKPVVS